MALWIDNNNIVHDDMDGDALSLPNWPQGLTPYTPPVPTAADIAAEQHKILVSDAIVALDSTDKVAYRCFKAGVSYPAEWQTYTIALRNIVNGTDMASTTLPIIPSYPSGT